MSEQTPHTAESAEHISSKKEEAEQVVRNLGFAGRLADSFIHSPLSPLLFIVMMAVGIYGLISTPRQEDPQISVPMVDILMAFPGASSQEVVDLYVEPYERVLSEIPGIKHVWSATQREMGMITLEFDVGQPMGPSIVKVQSKLAAHKDLMPPGAQEPVVRPKEVDDVPVVTLTLWSEEVMDEQLRTLAHHLQQRLNRVSGTGPSFVVGGRARQMRVEVLPERLSGYNISVAAIAQTVQSANSGHTVGSIERDNRFFFVESGAYIRSAREIERLVVGMNPENGAPIFLRDVAEVREWPEETKQIATWSAGPADAQGREVRNAAAVTVAFSKQAGTNGVSVVNAVLEEVERLKGYVIPDNVFVEVTRNYGKSANEKVNDLLFKLFVATAAVTVLVWMSLGFKPSMVVLLTIPVVLVVTVFIAMLMGYTIDRVSLFALIFSIGFLVDNAIVIVENVYRRWLLKGEMDTATAVDAVREVGNPTVLATYTVVAALVPMGFVSGMMGPYMQPIPALGSIAMLLSLFSALVFGPYLAMRIRPTMERLHAMEARDEKIDAKMDKLFRSIILALVRNRALGWAFLFGLLLAFAGSMWMFYNTAVPVKMLPFDNKTSFSVVVDMPDGTALPETANFVNRVNERVLQIPEVVASQTYVGTAQPYDFNGLVRHYYMRQFPWQGEIAIQLMDKGARNRTSHEIASALRAELQPLARELGVSVTVVEMPPGPPVLQTVVAEVYGPDPQTRRQVAADLTEIFRESELLADVDNYMNESMDTWRFVVDVDKAARQGVSVDSINKHLALVMGEAPLGDIKQSDVHEPTKLVLTIPMAVRAQLSRLADLPIMTMDQRTIPLSELGTFQRVARDPIVIHKDLRPVEFVVGDTVGRLGAPVYAMFDVERLLKEKGYVSPDGAILNTYYTGAPETDRLSAIQWAGEWTVTFETFRDMGGAFAVALIGIYMLVVWAFGNFMIPAVIMAPIPLTLLGIVPGHWFLNAEFTATSMIGWIALAGIIVRNSILLVDFTLEKVNEGMPFVDAVINSTKARTRPILITALALVLGSSVILFDPIFQGMAVSLLFGVFVSTLLTLVVIPLGCISLGEDMFKKVAQQRAAAAN